MAYKMNGHTLPGIKQKKRSLSNDGKLYAGPYRKNSSKGPVAIIQNTYNEKEEQVIENMDNAKDNNFDGHTEIKINKMKK